MNTSLKAKVRQKSDFVVKPVEYEEELRLANDLMAKSHTPNYFTAKNWFSNHGEGYPGYRKEHTRIALRNGELAGALRLTTDTMRLGEARLKMGGLGWVTSAPRHRHKGVCTLLMEDSLRYMADHGYHVSMLFGIPNFYHRFGYVTVLADYSIVLDAFEAAANGATPRHRPVKPGDIPALQKIHAANDAGVPCSLLRSSAHFSNRWDFFKDAIVFTNDSGKVVGYLQAREAGEEIVVEEVGVRDSTVFDDVLAACSHMAQESFAARIRFLVPPGHPISQFLTTYPSVHETRRVREQGGMMTCVNIGETLESMTPEWESRIAMSGVRDLRSEVTLMVDGVSYRIRSTRGAIDFAQAQGRNKLALTLRDLTRLLTGYTYLNDILDAERRLITTDARDLLQAIFPKRDPYVWSFDRF